jgi:nitrogen regulatory protein P-II 1
MKEIRAYVREKMASRVIEALERAGCTDFSILEVRGIASGLPREQYDFSVSLGEQFERLIKFEIVCRDENAENFAQVLQGAATTGQRGDGRVFIVSVDTAIRISDGLRGANGLEA